MNVPGDSVRRSAAGVRPGVIRVLPVSLLLVLVLVLDDDVVGDMIGSAAMLDRSARSGPAILLLPDGILLLLLLRSRGKSVAEVVAGVP